MLNPFDFGGLRFLVTGASSGIGRETAIYLSRLGARIVLVGRDEERLRQTLEQMEGDGHVVEPFDLSSGDAILGWIKNVTKDFGTLDGLFHSAGIHEHYPLQLIDTQIMEEMYRVNTISGVLLVRGFQQKGCFNPGSSIVLTASTSGILGVPANTPYSASKAAIIAIVKTLSLELVPKKIRVNCVAPAVTETEMVVRGRETMTEEAFQAIIDAHPLGLGLPSDVAYAVAFLLAPSARWITGSTLIIDGGLTVP